MRFRGGALLLLAALAVFAQNDSPQPAFEAASVKAVTSGRLRLPPFRGGPGTSSPGQLSGVATFKALLMRAYDLRSYQISGPLWVESERYEIAAKIPAGAGREQVSRMLQSLLAERFGLAAHKETRMLPIFALLPAKGGGKLKPSPPVDPGTPAPTVADDGTLARRDVPKLARGPDGFPDLLAGSNVPRSYQAVVAGPDGILYKLWARRETMQQLAERLSSQLNRPVIDMTCLRDQYDFTLAWAMESAGGGVPRTDPPPDQIEMLGTPVMSDPDLSLFTALQTQLGLRLEPRKGPLEILIVDRAERTPTGN